MGDAFGDRQNELAAAERICPFCGGALIEIHAMTFCTNCHVLIDACCEGTPPNRR